MFSNQSRSLIRSFCVLGGFSYPHSYRLWKWNVKARNKLSCVYSEDTLNEHQCQKWFEKFRSSNFCLEDAPRSGRSVETDEGTIKTWIDAKRQIATWEIVKRLNLSNSIVHHLKLLGLISKFNISVSYFGTKKCFLKESFEIKKYFYVKLECRDG